MKIEGGETLEWVTQRASRSHIPENTQGQFGLASEEFDLVEDVSACCIVELD